jgi:hypothetical protein
MGKKSRLKAARRSGLRPPTSKERQRAELKAHRRAHSVAPTEDDYGRAAAAGPDVLAYALAARHTARIDNLSRIPQKHLEKCYQQLHCLHEVSAACANHRYGPLLLRGHMFQLTDHLTWAVDSAMAAIRLLLAGQYAGAAIIVQQQLGRWTLLLAQTVCDEPDPLESADEILARVWTWRAIEKLGRRTADVLAEARFDDIDELTPAASTATSYACVRLADRRMICPATVYRHLSQIASATRCAAATAWECTDGLDPASIPPAVDAATGCISDGLELCILNLQEAVTALNQTFEHLSTTDNDPPTTSSAVTHGRRDDRPAVWRSKLDDPAVSSLTPALIPLTPIALATSSTWNSLGGLYGHYRNEHASLSSRTPRSPEDIAKLAFAAHRYNRLLIAEENHQADLMTMSKQLVAQHLSPRCAYILTAELAGLCARWNQSRPEISNAAMLISSTLRSGYWLWLEEDDRAMGILRWTLHHTARLRAWYTNAELARQLESISLASHTDWITAAGWSNLMHLDLALFEFAHANPHSRQDTTDTLGDARAIDRTDPTHTRLSRQKVLDWATELAASEIVRVVAAQQSTLIAEAMQEALQLHVLDISENTPSIGFLPQERVAAPQRHQLAKAPR